MLGCHLSSRQKVRYVLKKNIINYEYVGLSNWGGVLGCHLSSRQKVQYILKQKNKKEKIRKKKRKTKEMY